MLISEAFELYRIEYIVFRNQSERTEEMHKCAEKTLLDFCGDIDIKDLSFDLIRKWKKHLEKTRSINTVRGYIIKLRVVLKHMQNKGINVLNPDIIGVPKRKNASVSFITPKEVSALVKCAFRPAAGYSKINRYRNRAIISLLYASGIRVSELTSLDRLSIRDDGTFTIIGKCDKARLCFTDERTQKYIKEYLDIRNDNVSALFISDKTKKRITSNTVQEIFRNIQKKSGFEKQVHPHTLRHSFATNLLRNNANLVYVRDFLGHSSIQTTAMYTHVVNEDLKKIYNKKHSY